MHPVVDPLAAQGVERRIDSADLPAAPACGLPMRRLGTIEEVADLIWFLCSAQATYITGAEIPINGGQHA